MVILKGVKLYYIQNCWSINIKRTNYIYATIEVSPIAKIFIQKVKCIKNDDVWKGTSCCSISFNIPSFSAGIPRKLEEKRNGMIGESKNRLSLLINLNKKQWQRWSNQLNWIYFSSHRSTFWHLKVEAHLGIFPCVRKTKPTEL